LSDFTISLKKGEENHLLLDFDWDGKILKGVLNPGTDHVTLQNLSFEPPVGGVFVEDGKRTRSVVRCGKLGGTSGTSGSRRTDSRRMLLKSGQKSPKAGQKRWHCRAFNGLLVPEPDRSYEERRIADGAPSCFRERVWRSTALNRPRNPEENPLYKVISGNWETFLARQRERDRNDIAVSTDLPAAR